MAVDGDFVGVEGDGDVGEEWGGEGFVGELRDEERYIACPNLEGHVNTSCLALL